VPSTVIGVTGTSRTATLRRPTVASVWDGPIPNRLAHIIRRLATCEDLYSLTNSGYLFLLLTQSRNVSAGIALTTRSLVTQARWA